VSPIGWSYALGVWGYALAWLLVNSALKIATYRLIHLEHAPEAGHLARMGAPLHPLGG
jgi:H+-transporting ATPase